MNSNFGKRSSGPINSFDFDLGLGSSQGRPLNGQKSQTSSYTSSNSQPRPAWQPGKPSWTHQPAPKQSTIRSEIGSGPTSMVGDIHGKTWGSASGSGSGIGIVNKDPSLFGDLVGSAIGQGKSSRNVPLKNAPPVSASGSSKSPYSMGNFADSLPKSGNSMKPGGGMGYSSNPSGFSGGYKSSGGMNSGVNANSSPNLGGPSMKNMSGGNLSGSGLSSNSDPFGSLVGFGSKPSGSINSGIKTGKVNNNAQSDAFGNFQGVSNVNSSGFASKSNTFSSGGGFNASNVDFCVQPSGPQSSSANDDPLGMFSSSKPTAAAATPQTEDWGFESFDGGAGSTTELDGLPPPPPGVSATSAKSKGIDNQRQGQYADAIKWLSWAVILMDRAGDEAGSAEVLSTRASCYKEVGEYKKAVADCTKVLDHDKKNVTILVQRALLYESMEKYKLGAEDLRMVLKIDPGNRIARSTVHRLTKMAG
ncbi:tetratricopeptide repeat-containing protein [Arabidopsis lyrata subsp. lyrata]|uniref:Tetratricopeptide repeat-containing protein n=1 Tax=Arabidopsis lyrata subsp. lyrata TaxID=81972 RepID=D7L668_ARALL|nr:tetratricopeptide repeat-containing protein [Arabidopsis lyrata subsp. lyrata]